MGTEQAGASELAHLDALEKAIRLNKGASVLLCHLIDSRLGIQGPELETLSELMDSVTGTLSELSNALKSDLRGASQGREYWRGYEDGKAAAVASMQQKAIAAKGV